MSTKKVKKVVKTAGEEKVCSKKKVIAKKVVPVKKTSEKKTVATVASEKKIQDKNNTSYIIIDHPCENETIYGDNYVIRIGASFDGYVEVSFNDGEWQPCRFASGYWWFDWAYYKSGDCKISARLVANDGTVIKISDIRKCKVS